MYNDHKVKPLHIIPPKTSAHIKRYDEQTKPAHNKEFLKTKIKLHSDEVTDFYDKEIRKVDSNHTCSAVISSDSTLKKYDNHYPQAFLKE